MKKEIGMNDILQLVKAGYTRAEIDAMVGVFDDDTPEAPKEAPEATKEAEADKIPEKSAEAPETPQEAPKAEEMTNDTLREIVGKIDSLTKAIQASNIKQSSLPVTHVDNIEDILQKIV